MPKLADTWSQGYEILDHGIVISEELSQEAQKKIESSASQALIDYKCRLDYSFRESIRKPHKVREFTKKALMTLGYTDFTVCDHLQNLAAEFMKKFKVKKVNCRIDLTFSDNCRKFHADAVHARAITTLMGPATEYKSTCETAEVQQIETGETIILKGLRYPGPKTNTLHKSPMISHLDIYRIIFVIDY